MNAYKLIAAFGLILPPASLWAQKNLSAGPSLEQLVGEMKNSTDTLRVQALGQLLSERVPRTKKEAALVLELLKEEHSAPYAQMSIARSTEPALGPALHGALKAEKAALKDMSDAELKNLPPEAQKSAMTRAMNIAAIVHALGNVKHKSAVQDLRELLSHNQEFEGYIAWEASKALGELGDEQSMEAIMQAASQNKTITLSGFKVRGIRKIVDKIDEIDAGSQGQSKNLLDPEVVKRYGQIHDLAQQLGYMGRKDPEVKNALRQLLNHKQENVRVWASNALVNSIEPSDKDVTLEMLRHRDSGVRLRGLDSLYQAKTWDKSFLPILIDMMQQDPNSIVRDDAIDTFTSLAAVGIRRKEFREAVPYLEILIKDKSNKGLQFGAFQALRAITGRWYPYDGMPSGAKALMKVEPAYKPELGGDEPKTTKP